MPANSNKTSDYSMSVSKNRYMIVTKTGNIITQAKWYDYSTKNFDWLLIADVETKEKFRGLGYASKLMNFMINDLLKKYPNKGIYLMVKPDNKPAIALYRKTGFKTLKEYKRDGKSFLIMYTGRVDTNQLDKMQFSV